MRILDFFDGAQSETAPTIGNIVASGIIKYPNDATYEASEQGSPACGNIYYNTTTDLLRYYNGTEWIDIVDDRSLQTIINKTIDADNNTIINIDNDEIKAGAAIDVTKLHDGSVDNTEFGHLDGVTSPIQTQLDGKQNLSEKGQPDGYAPLDSNGIVPLANLPVEQLDNVDEHPDLASFPATGLTDVIYIAADTGITYRWSGSQYVQVGSSVSELSDLTDADTTGIIDGQVMVWNATNSQLEPQDLPAGSLGNIALIGAGTASFTAPSGGASFTSTYAQLDTTNAFAINNGAESSVSFIASATGPLQFIQTTVDSSLATGDGVLHAELYNVDAAGLPIGSALDVSTDTLTSALGSQTQNINLIFSQTVTLTAGTKYAIVFVSTDSTSLFLQAAASDLPDTENGTSSPVWTLSNNQNSISVEVFVAGSTPQGTIVLDQDLYLSVPPLLDNTHKIETQTINIGNDQVAYITIDKSATGPTTRTVNVSDITSFVLSETDVIFARVSGDVCHFGLHDPQRIENGQVIDVQVGGSEEPLQFVESTDLSANTLTSAFGVFYELNSAWTITLDPGTWDIYAQFSIVQAANSGSAFSTFVITPATTAALAGSQAVANTKSSTFGPLNGTQVAPGNFANHQIFAREVTITQTTTFRIWGRGGNFSGASSYTFNQVRNNLNSAFGPGGIFNAREVKS